MKDSGIEWLGLIPSHWKIIRGKNLLNVQNRNVDENTEVITCFRDGEVTLRSKRREEGYTFSDKEIGYQGIYEGDLVIHGMDGFAGAIGISDSYGKGSPILIVCTAKLNTNNLRFIMYYLRTLAMQKVFLALATGIRERSCDLRWKKIANLSFIVPPLAEQKKIADFLDKKCSAIDSAVDAAKKLAEKLREYKKSLITETVTKGLNPSAEMKDSGIEWLGLIPSHWKICRTLYILSMPITDGPHETPELYGEGVPFVSAEAVSCGNGKIDFNHIRGYISQEYYQECCKKYIPKKNDVYMIKSGATTGKVAVVDTDKIFTIWSPLAVFRANEKFHYKYLFYFLQSDAYQKQVELNWSYGTQQNIGMRVLEKLKIFFPSLAEQKKIADFLDKKCAAIDESICRREKLIEKLREYKKSLMYEVVTGKLEV